MAEVTAMRNNALPYPVYGAPFTVTFPMLDADGDLVTGATTPDAEVSLNGNTFADCTNESTEIATNSGVYYLTLTAAEMTADIVTVIAKSATSGMKTTVLTLYPRKLVSMRANTSASLAVLTNAIVLDASASAIDDFYNGMICVAVIDGTTEVRMISDYTGSTQTAAVVPDWNTAPDNNDTFTIYRPDGVQMQQANVSHWNSLATVSLPLVPTTAGRTLDVSAGGEAGVDWANVGSPTTTVGLSGTTIKEVTDVETTLATIAGYIDTEVGAIKTNTDKMVFTVANQLDVNVKSNAGTAITAAAGIQEVKVASIAANAITATAISADAITDAKVAADVTIASVTGAVGSVTGSVGSVATGGITRASLAADTGLQPIRSNTATAGSGTTITLDAGASATNSFYTNDVILITGGTGVGQARFISGYVGATKVATVATWTTNPDNTSTFAILPFDAVAGASAPTAAQVADAVWEEAIADHSGTSGSTAEQLAAAGAAGDPWNTALPGAYASGKAGYILGTNLNATVSSRATQTSVDTIDDYVDTEVGAIKTQTDKLVFTVANQLDVNVLDWKSATAPAMTGDAFARLGAPAGASVSADIAAVKVDTAAIKAKTDNLPSDPADASDIAGAFSTVNGTLATIAGYIDTEVGAIKTTTDKFVFTVANKVDANILAINGDATSAADLAKTTRALGRGTVSGSPSTTSIPTSACVPVGAVADQFKGRIITFDADTTTTALRGQATDITASTNAAAPVFTVSALTTAPVVGDTFSIS